MLTLKKGSFFIIILVVFSLIIGTVAMLYGQVNSRTYLPTMIHEGATDRMAPTLKKGVNLAGDFEVEPRGEWGTPIEAHFFDLAAEGGFDHVRLPIRWSAHTGPAPDFLIDEAFFAEIDWALDQAERVGLSIMINTHHFEELDSDPWGNRDQLLAIWRQVGARYANRPPTVVFELNNEPMGAFNDDPEAWNQILADALAVVRETNPERLVVIGPVEFNHPNRLVDLRWPDDPNLMATIHVYDPVEFTNQGAPWFDPPPATGEVWSVDQPTLDFAWRNDTWDSVMTRTEDGFQVAFERQFAAFAATRLAGAAGAFERLTVETDRPFPAVILCNVNTDDLVIVEVESTTPSDNGWFEISADISSCGSITAVAVQLDSETLVAPVLRRVDLCANAATPKNECERLIVTGAESLDREMRRAAEWAAANEVEMYLGEFGIYDHPPEPVDRPSRNAWLRTIRQAAEAHDINWAYFELSNDFSVYDHANGRWREDILAALFD